MGSDDQQWEFEKSSTTKEVIAVFIVSATIALASMGATLQTRLDATEASNQAALAELQDMRTMALKIAQLELRLDALKQELLVICNQIKTPNEEASCRN